MNHFVVSYIQGAYGNYLRWALYSFSELNIEKTISTPFCQNGSSHKRINVDNWKSIGAHPGPNGQNKVFQDPDDILSTKSINDLKTIAIVSSNLTQLLEYFNNASAKRINGHRTTIEKIFKASIDMSESDLIDHISRRIKGVFQQEYVSMKYIGSVSDYSVTSDDLLDNFYEHLVNILDVLELELLYDYKTIDGYHRQYLDLQQFRHNYLKLNDPNAILTMLDKSWLKANN